MSRSTWQTIRAVVALLVCLWAVVSVLGFAGMATAESDRVDVKQNNASLTVTVAAPGGNTSRPTTVISAGGTTVRQPLTRTENGSDYRHTFELATSDLAKQNLSRASITVRQDDEVLMNDTRDLRYVAPLGNPEVINNTLRIESTVVGVPSGEEITIQAEGGGISQTGKATVTETGESGRIRLDASIFRGWAGDNVTVRPTNVANGTKPFRLLTEALTMTRTVNGTLIIENPLLADREYAVQLTGAGEKSFARRVDASPGRLELPARALAAGDTLRIVDAQTGGAVVDGVSLSDDRAVTRANLTNASTIVWPSPVESASALWIQAGDETERIPVEADGTRTLRLSSRVGSGADEDYRLILDGESETTVARIPRENASAAIQSTGGSASGSESSSGSSIDLPLPDLPLPDLPIWILVVVLITGGAALVASVMIIRSGDDGPSTNSAGLSGSGRGDDPNLSSGSSTVTTGDVHLRVHDETTGERIRETTVVLKPVGTTHGRDKRKRSNQRRGRTGMGSHGQGSAPRPSDDLPQRTRDERTVDITNGEKRITLAAGQWRARPADQNGESVAFSVEGSDRGSATEVDLELPPLDVEIVVRDEHTDQPISDVLVRVETDEIVARERTNHDGKATIGVPRLDDLYEMSVEHEKYETKTVTGTLQGSSAEIALSPLEGGLEIRAVCDGDILSGAEVMVKTRDDVVHRLRDDRWTSRTGEEGTVQIDGLLEGTYHVELGLPDEFGATETTVEVRGNDCVAKTLRSVFEFELTPEQRERVTRLRRSAADLDVRESLDGGIHRYYASVLTGLLDNVEQLPDQGYRFVGVDASPEALVDALLDAIERVQEKIEAALSTSRNADLFIACADLPAAHVTYDGAGLSDLFETLGDSWADQQRRLADQLSSVDDRISAEQNELTVVSPARDPWERIREFIQTSRPADRTEAAAVAFVASVLLDAIDGVFEHDQLRKRFQQTVF